MGSPLKKRISQEKRLQLSIIIVNYNVKYFLEQCLFSLQAALTNIESEIFVIDNASTDGSKEYLTKKFNWVHFIWLPENLGFGKANNLALQNATGQYILFLNPDTILPEDSLQQCLQYMHRHPQAGALGVRMIDGSGKFLKESKRMLPTTWVSFYKISGLAALFPRSKKWAAYYAGHLPEKEIGETDILAGAFMMCSRKAIDLTRGFDEDFFMYGEDVDLSYRIQQAGLRNIYFAETTILHFKGESTQRFSREYVNRFYDAMQLFSKKHFTKGGHTRLLSLAINLAKGLAHSKRLMNKGISLPRTKPTDTAIISTQPEFSRIIHILKNASNPILIKGRIAFGDDDQDAQIGNIKNIDTVIKENQLKQIVFAAETLGFKKIISLTEKIKKPVLFLFHAGGSHSIVGSTKKNNQGITIF
ncbi:MAG: glycosyltransferase family 2 protein [Sphingobacteriales bacterium]|nr:glycosyltransferase family 2 protein [Sphingobacteriales bacterium]